MAATDTCGEEASCTGKLPTPCSRLTSPADRPPTGIPPPHPAPGPTPPSSTYGAAGAPTSAGLRYLLSMTAQVSWAGKLVTLTSLGAAAAGGHREPCAHTRRAACKHGEGGGWAAWPHGNDGILTPPPKKTWRPRTLGLLFKLARKREVVLDHVSNLVLVHKHPGVVALQGPRARGRGRRGVSTDTWAAARRGGRLPPSLSACIQPVHLDAVLAAPL